MHHRTGHSLKIRWKRLAVRLLLGGAIALLPLLSSAPAQAGIFDFLFGTQRSRGRATGREQGGAVRTGQIIGATNAGIPYIVMPRNTYLLDSQFVIEWNPVPNAQTYWVKLWRWADGHGQREWLVWEATTSETRVSYNGQASSQFSLSPARYYSIEVTAITPEGRISSDQDVGCAATGFSLLFPENANLLNAELAQVALPEALLPASLASALEPDVSAEIALARSSPEAVAPEAVAPERIPADTSSPAESLPESAASAEISPAEMAPEEVSPEAAVSAQDALAAADIYLRYGLLDLAIKALQTPEAWPTSIELNLALADLYSYAGLTALALEQYATVLQLDPEPLYAASALEGVGVLEVGLGRFEAAQTSLGQARDLYGEAYPPLAAAVNRRLQSLTLLLQSASQTAEARSNQPGESTACQASTPP
ncbi:MAG: hypothetical protein ICV62_03595 [Cyanobacteria bacterium Co-bin13]|nr:hypothetical protein [Cyanobacteria bacterium Co-bin13]